MIKSVKTPNEEIPEKLSLHPIYNVYVRLMKNRNKFSSGFEFSVFLYFYFFVCFKLFILLKFCYFSDLNIALLLRNAMANWRIFAQAFQTLVVGADDFADLECSSVKDANFLFA